MIDRCDVCGSDDYTSPRPEAEEEWIEVCSTCDDLLDKEEAPEEVEEEVEGDEKSAEEIDRRQNAKLLELIQSWHNREGT